MFSGLLIKAQEEMALHGISIGRGAPTISHLFYSLHDAHAVNKILDLYQLASDQPINLDNSEISFSRNVTEEKIML